MYINSVVDAAVALTTLEIARVGLQERERRGEWPLGFDAQ
jgi:hypothetical protein